MLRTQMVYVKAINTQNSVLSLADIDWPNTTKCWLRTTVPNIYLSHDHALSSAHQLGKFVLHPRKFRHYYSHFK